MADHDHILLHMVHFGNQRIFIVDLEAIDWPPPEGLFMDGDTNLLDYNPLQIRLVVCDHTGVPLHI